MELCFLKRLEYISDYCRNCSGTPEHECYETREDAQGERRLMQEMFLKRFEVDNGSIQDRLEAEKQFDLNSFINI